MEGLMFDDLRWCSLYIPAHHDQTSEKIKSSDNKPVPSKVFLCSQNIEGIYRGSERNINLLV